MGKPTGFLEIERHDRTYEKPAKRLKNYREFVEPMAPAEASAQAARCMDCGIPFCHQGCPVNNQIPDWNNLVYRDQWRIALDNLHSTNNFPEFTGRICPAPCEASCTLNLQETPVTIKSIECEIVDRGWKEGWILPQRPERVTGDTAFYLKHSIRACRGGVPRAHIIPYALDGSLLLELFLHDGVGTMISYENLESLREATPDDVGGILSLIEPLESDGTLVRRGRHQIERDIDHFSVIEHDGVLFGCAALYPYPQERIGEMACLTVAPEAQGTGDGERLLKRIEQRARARGLTRIFVLTTRTEHWFLKRGFVKVTVDDLPEDRRRLYNWQRKSLVLMKQL